MENIEKMIDETTGVTEVVEVVTDKLTFKENCMAYALTGVFVTGLVTVGYMGYKGGKKLVNKIRNKKECKEQTDETVIDVDFKKDENSNEEDSE